MIAHPFGVAGLVTNTVATLLLLRFPPAATSQYTEDGRIVAGWVGVPTPEGQRQHRIAKRGYLLAVSLLALGFLLQLLDLLLSA